MSKHLHMACSDASPSQLRVFIVLISASLSLGFLGTIVYAVVFKDGLPWHESHNSPVLRVQGPLPVVRHELGLLPHSMKANASKRIAAPARRHVHKATVSEHQAGSLKAIGSALHRKQSFQRALNVSSHASYGQRGQESSVKNTQRALT